MPDPIVIPIPGQQTAERVRFEVTAKDIKAHFERGPLEAVEVLDVVVVSGNDTSRFMEWFCDTFEGARTTTMTTTSGHRVRVAGYGYTGFAFQLTVGGHPIQTLVEATVVNQFMEGLCETAVALGGR